MVDAGDLPHVLEVRDDIGQSRGRLGVGLAPGPTKGAVCRVVSRVDPLGSRSLTRREVPLPDGR